MSNTVVVAYDGSNSADTAINFAVDLAKSLGASLVVAHVLEWSPYSFLTPNEIEERHVRRQEELERAETAVVAPVMEKLKAAGVTAEATIKYGQVAETLISIAQEASATQIVMGRTGHSSLSSRLFGSVAGSLAQVSPVAVTIVP